MFTTSSYAVRRARLESDDSLLLYTDGISEAHDPSGNEYGIGGLSLAAGEKYGLTPEELVTACMEDLERHSSGTRQADDQTLMAIQRAQSRNASFND
jgi:sigma-B regulation protein RsbU (phosphoserine phosphatase)